MKKELLLMLVIVLIFLVGCGQETEELVKEPGPVEEQTQQQRQVQEQQLEEEMIDQPEEPSCSDECASDTCSGYKHYACVLQDDGCRHKVDKGIVKGKCGVECLFNSDCSQDQECMSYKCETKKLGLDLSNLPEPFLEDTFIIIGYDGASVDVFSAVKVATMLQHESGKEVPTKLDNEIAGQESEYNLIIIGNPCDNLAVEKIFGIACGGLDLDEGKAIIKLAANGNNAAMLISGKTPSDALRAAKMVAEYESYSLKGTEIIV